ncbi:uncharacterized protein [Montipora foliosa]|uniref:uncharacterized protein n=1 Tax=Montipora foliosa TaxID=591990 RepID=UPI0035F1E268
MDVPSDADTIRLKDLLNSMGLVQHVKRPTHIHGHTLDLIITRQADGIVDGEPFPERYFSDHATVICKLSVMKPAPRNKHAEYRKLKSIDITKLREASRNSQLHQDPPDDFSMLLDCYNTTLKSLLDEHAPVCSRHVITRPRPPLFNYNIIQARRDRRKAERRWKKTRLPSELVVFKVKRNYVVHLMNEDSCTHYRPFIDKNSSDQSKLFRANKSLFNLQEDKSLPPHTNTSVLANEMGEYFIHKVVAIRSKLAGEAVPHAVSTKCAPHSSSSTDDVVTLSQFQSLSEEAVRKMAVASMKTCALDPLTSSILLLCIEELLPVITRMLNISLKHGYFADEWKKALVHPLLKNLIFN